MNLADAFPYSLRAFLLSLFIGSAAWFKVGFSAGESWLINMLIWLLFVGIICLVLFVFSLPADLYLLWQERKKK